MTSERPGDGSQSSEPTVGGLPVARSAGPAPRAPKDHKEELAALRSFGLLVGGILLAWGALRLWRERHYGVPMMSVGAILGFAGILLPQALRLPHRAWMALGHVLGAINTRVLLFLTFWLVVVPFGALRRLFSGSALQARPRDLPGGGKSYFRDAEKDARGAKHFDNMF